MLTNIDVSLNDEPHFFTIVRNREADIKMYKAAMKLQKDKMLQMIASGVQEE